jgi:putative transposase
MGRTILVIDNLTGPCLAPHTKTKRQKMPKQRPPYTQGNYYHFYNRGSHKQSIFHDPRDYTYLLRHLKTYAQKFAVAIIAYCLLPNHYHILARQDNHVEARVLIQRLFNRYGKTYRGPFGPCLAPHIQRDES